MEETKEMIIEYFQEASLIDGVKDLFGFELEFFGEEFQVTLIDLTADKTVTVNSIPFDFFDKQQIFIPILLLTNVVVPAFARMNDIQKLPHVESFEFSYGSNSAEPDEIGARREPGIFEKEIIKGDE